MQILYVSWSQLRHHEQCRQKAHLIRTGMKNPAQNIRVFFPGTVVDRVMRAYLADEAREPGSMARSVKEVMDREEQAAIDSCDGIVKWKSRADRIEVLAFCTDLVNRLEPILAETILPYEFEPSKRFKRPVSIPYIDGTPATIFLVGEMDILLRDLSVGEAHPWQVWDLKATRNDSYWRSTIGQLVFYDLVVYIAFGQYTHRSGLIQPMCKQPLVSIEVTNQQRVEMMQRIIAMAHQIWKKDTDVADTTKHCFMCPVKYVCPRFQPVGKRMQLGIGSTDLGSFEIDTTPEASADYTVDDAIAELTI